MPRPPRCRMVRTPPLARRFGPYDLSPSSEVVLPLEGLEALRLSDLEGLEQEEAAQIMGVSRQTFGRVLAAARGVVSAALAGGLGLRIEGGAYEMAPPMAGLGRGRGRRGRGGMGRGGGF